MSANFPFSRKLRGKYMDKFGNRQEKRQKNALFEANYGYWASKPKSEALTDTTKASLVNTFFLIFTTTDCTDYTAACPRDFII